MPDASLNLRYGAEAFALFAIAWGVMKWVGRNARAARGDGDSEPMKIGFGLTDGAAAHAADALRARGLVSNDQLAAMSARERAMLLATVAERIGAPEEKAAQAARAARAARPVAEAPSVGRRVHCPACGEALDRAHLIRHGEVECRGCRRELSGHVQRGRLTLIVEDEAELRQAAR